MIMADDEETFTGGGVTEDDLRDVNRRAIAAGRYYKDKNGKLQINNRPVEEPPLPRPKPKKSTSGAALQQPQFDKIASEYVK